MSIYGTPLLIGLLLQSYPCTKPYAPEQVNVIVRPTFENIIVCREKIKLIIN